MAREKMFDPAYQKAFTEAILKENQIRMNWHMTYGTGGKRSEAVKWDEDPEDDGCHSKRGVPGVSREPKPWTMPPKEERAWPASKTPVSRTIPRLTQPPKVMKPVPRELKTILYQGLSHDGEGRAQYLRRRCLNTPEERYFFPVCSSWEYGWTYGVDVKDMQCPKHFRRQA